jgi:hypothetical protein
MGVHPPACLLPHLLRGLQPSDPIPIVVEDRFPVECENPKSEAKNPKQIQIDETQIFNLRTPFTIADNPAH